MREHVFVQRTAIAKIGDDTIRSVGSIDITVAVEVVVVAACGQYATGIDSGVARFVRVA